MPQYCLITHTIHSVAIDGPDTNRDPDHHPVTGMVTFEPLLGKGDSVVVTTNGQPTTIVLTPIEARITNGEIYHRGEKGIKLFAGGSDTNPEKIRYKATFHNLIAGGKPLTLKEIIFETIPGGTIHLSQAQPVPGAPYPGYSVQMEQALTTIATTKAMALTEIETARTTALGQVNTAVTTAVTAQMGTKADKTTVEQLTGQVMATMGIAGSALRRTKAN